MAQGNLVWVRGDITGDIYFDHLQMSSGDQIPYVRLYMMVDGNKDLRPVKGLRIMAYGALAELVYGHVQKGSRIGVEGHIQMRDRGENSSPVFEVVIEQVDFIRNINYERGNQVTAELKRRGRLKSTTGVPAEMLENITTAAGGDSQNDISAK